MIDGKELELLRELKSKFQMFEYMWNECFGLNYSSEEKTWTLDGMERQYKHQIKTIKEHLDRIEGEAFNEKMD